MEAFQIRSRSAYHMKACDVTWRRGLALGTLTSPQCPVEDLRNQPSLTVAAFVFSTTTIVLEIFFMHKKAY